MIQTLDDLDMEGVAVGVRIDINSPLAESGLADDARLLAHVETLSELAERGARVVILAHQGRPGGDDFETLEAHAERLDELLSFSVDYLDATFSVAARERIAELEAGEAVVLENTRFYAEEYMEFEPERAADTHLVEGLSPALDVYVNDAFAAAHRSQPSLVGFPQRLPGYAGRVMERELDVLGSIEETPSPRIYLLGGAKVGDSIGVARSVLERGLADTVLTAGLVGNVCLLAGGAELGTASAEFIYDRGYWDEIDRAGELLDTYEELRVPEDVAIERDGERHEISVADLPAETETPAKDVGSQTIATYSNIIESAGTVILNGPAGVFEEETFAHGTRELYEAATRAEHSIVGGGDTASAIRQLEIEGFDHVSTGGGASLALLSGDSLPAVEALR